MNTTNCGCQPGCTAIAFVASAIVGVLAAFFRFSALITVTPAFLWVLLGIAVGFLGIALPASFYDSEKKSCCKSLTHFLAGILGTILTAILLLGIAFAATSVAGAIITGLLLFFFSLLITNATCLIACKSNCN